jgi:broad specificity phosphatase PhoE
MTSAEFVGRRNVDMSGLRRVYLVRHGETAWSKTGQHTGRTDLPLTEEGERQAAQLKGRLAGLDVAEVYSSPLRRARHTAELAGFGERAVIMEDLIEWDYGAYEGKTSKEIHLARPDWDLFRDGGPGGESPAAISARADRIVARLRGFAGDALLFSSGHLLRVLAARWVGENVTYGKTLALDPASLSILSYEHVDQDPVVRLWNEYDPHR